MRHEDAYHIKSGLRQFHVSLSTPTRELRLETVFEEVCQRRAIVARAAKALRPTPAGKSSSPSPTRAATGVLSVAAIRTSTEAENGSSRAGLAADKRKR